MRALLANKIAAALLMLTVLVAQQLCVCAKAIAATPEKMAADHSCCASEAPAKPAAPLDASHDGSCPHCGDARVFAGTGETVIAVDLSPRIEMPSIFAPKAERFASLLLPAAPAPRCVPHAAGPPPDVLRVTGILLI